MTIRESLSLRTICSPILYPALVASGLLAATAALAAESGRLVDVVPWGEPTRWTEDGSDCGVIWEDARDVSRVIVAFADPAAAASLDDLRVEYWQSSWPERRIPRDRPSGAGGSGWLNVGDWFQGKWVPADTTVDEQGGTYAFAFNPVNAKEFPKLADFPARYRSTLKLRVVSGAPLPQINSFAALTDSVWKPLEFEIEWGGTAQVDEQCWDGHLEIFNGVVRNVEPLSPGSAVQVGPDRAWTSTVRGSIDGIRARLLYTKTNAHNSFDETVVTLRAARDAFSFAASDLIEHGSIFVPSFGVIVRKAGDPTSYEMAKKAWQANRRKNIYHRVQQLPEQTLCRAWKDTPQKGRFYIPLSFEGGRQHFGVEPDGNIFCHWNWLSRIPGRDTKRCLYDGDTIRFQFGLNAADVTDRQTVDGCLPMVVTEWQRDGVRYRQTAFVVPFDGVPQVGKRIRADDTLVLMTRFEMQRSDDVERTAALDIRVVADRAEQLILENGLLLAAQNDLARLRMFITSSDPSDSYSLQAEDESASYRANLTADKPLRTLDIAIPYITLTQPQEWTQLRSLRFEASFAAVRDYWRTRLRAGTQIDTPEPMINDFYKAHLSHLLINTERETGTSDRYMAKVGTFHYGVFSNESCMMISDLDRRGYHQRAEQTLNTWLHYQGSVGLPGDFSTTEGQFYGAGGYEAGGYNQHHGFILWCMGEHYWYTRDNAWLRRSAPKIVKGCDWVIRERSRTIAEADRSPIRAIERGLLPPGYLEDIKDWRSWLSTNVYTWWGMHNAAAALDAAGLPDGKRLLAEAERYRLDILAAFTEATRRSPVVRLRDGSWIGHVPPDAHRRGRTFGWITETLEGAIHMIRCGIVEPHDRLATWIIQDYEDNLYLSDQYGYQLTGEEFEPYWFSRGGISMQANLLCNPIPYLLRDEPKHFLRAYFNAFAVSYFPDTRMMTEHALPNIGDWRGDHYKSSDEANSTYWLRLMFVQERGDELWLGAAIPRDWLSDGNEIGIREAVTYFGRMSVQFKSEAERGRIHMTINPPRRNPPKRIRARFRHPTARRITRCQVNGTEYSQFDAENEWVELTDCDKTTRVTVFYD